MIDVHNVILTPMLRLPSLCAKSKLACKPRILPRSVGEYLGCPATDLSEVVLANGELDLRWDAGIGAFDEAIGYGNCMNDGGAGAQLSMGMVSNPEKGPAPRILGEQRSACGRLFPILDASDSAYAKATLNLISEP